VRFFVLGKFTQFRTLAQLSLYLKDGPLFRLFTKQFPLFGDLYVPSVLRSPMMDYYTITVDF